jgi:hypothetical protein
MARQGSIATSKESRAGAASHGATRRGGESVELDENYDLISVLYHSLQGAETCERYIHDAENADDEELAEFFAETRDEQIRRAAKGRELLIERLGEAQEEEEEEEEEDEEDEEQDDEEELEDERED